MLYSRFSHRLRTLASGALAIALMTGLSACGYGSSHSGNTAGSLSRTKLYSSVDAIAADSDAVIVGKVNSTTVARDVDDTTDFTLSSVTVLDSLKGTEQPNGTVTVRQTGSASQSTPETLLQADDVVLLFLSESGLPGEQAKHYYITGATAGLYAADSKSGDINEAALSNASFSRVNTDSGDTLPATLTVDDVA